MISILATPAEIAKERRVKFNKTMIQMKTREDAVKTLEALIESLHAHPDEWENPTLERYLDAMIAWLESARVRQIQEPSWELFCQTLEAGKIYE